MALPLDREETASPASPVRSNTLNVIQDMIKGGKHGLITTQISPLRWVGGTAGGATVGLLYSISEAFWPTGRGGSSFLLGLDLPFGTIIVAARLIVRPGGGSNVMRFQFAKSTAGVGTILDFEDSATAGVDNTLTIGPFDPLVSGTSYMFQALRQSGAAESESIKLLELDTYLP